MKTSSVAIVLCLNIGTDPPDVVKTSPCARTECWLDPFSKSRHRSLESIGNALQKQYSQLQNKCVFRQLLDPTVEELRDFSQSIRQKARGDRVLFHYNGHGVPRPTPNGEIWFYNKTYTQYIPLSINELRTSMVGSPAIYILDCSGAGNCVPHFNVPPVNPCFEAKLEDDGDVTGASRADIVLAACGANEVLPMEPAYPADIFTSCLTTPIAVALRWFVLENPLSMEGVDVEAVAHVPGKLADRKTPLGELNWIFTAITDSIAWSLLPRPLFHRLFRQDLLAASLFRNFLLADRMLRTLGCTPLSLPRLPKEPSAHPLWESWDLAVEASLNSFLGLRLPPPMPPADDGASAVL
jgi:regulator-associated protein of mTOR